MRLHDTLTRSVKTLSPSREDGIFRLYCCGPTVYGPAHIGNFRTFTLQDVLRRALELEFGSEKVCHVRNITDVDDKTIRRSQQEGRTLKDFTVYWTEKFHADCAALNLLAPHAEPRATEFVLPAQHLHCSMGGLIQTLLDKDLAYIATDGSIYFRVNSFPEYGKLAHLDREKLRTQATNSAGEANDADEYDREQASDFALWKAYKTEDGPNIWDLGLTLKGTQKTISGRPGWHIECSAMSIHFLGETFDLHGGGVDLCFPHHENEIAQSEGATGKTFCQHWFHTAHLIVEGQKMSKSIGNFYTLADLEAKGYTAQEFRYTLLSAHYRQPLNFTFNGLDAARSALAKIAKAIRKFLKQVNLSDDQFSALHQGFRFGEFIVLKNAAQYIREEDLNIPGALGQFFKTIDSLGTNLPTASTEIAAILREISAFLFLLGIKLPVEPKSASVPEAVQELAAKRWEAKQSKNWAEADSLRNELAALGWQSKDRKDGYELIPL